MRIFIGISLILAVTVTSNIAGALFPEAKAKPRLKVTKTAPKSNEKNIAPDAIIRIKFNKKVSKGKTFSKIHLLQGNNKKRSIKRKINGKSLVITPVKKMKYNKKYTVKIPVNALKNKNTRALNRVYNLSFRTIAKAQGMPTPGTNEEATPTMQLLTETPVSQASSDPGDGVPPTPSLQPETTEPTFQATSTPTENTEPTQTVTPRVIDGTIMVPVIDGDWWYITGDDPDISPYQYTSNHGSNTCDFTIYQSKDSKWHAVACIRDTNCPPAARLFYHWESSSLTNPSWEPKGIFATPQEIGTPADDSGSTRGLQAPHCIIKDNKYYMFYNSDGAYCITGDDGINWKTDNVWNRLRSQGSYRQFTMGRDLMIFDNTERDGKFYAYYCGKANGIANDVFAYRTSTHITGPWSTGSYAARVEGNPESPFVLYRDGYYYLWQQSTVYVSDTPDSFNSKPLTNMWNNNGWAPEIIEHEGQYYAAVYGGGGLKIAKVNWVDVGVTSPVIYASWSGLATVGTAYTVTYRASQGDGVLTWEIDGVLPAGLEADTYTGYQITISGTPTVAGSYPLTLTVTDEDGQTHSVTTTITVS